VEVSAPQGPELMYVHKVGTCLHYRGLCCTRTCLHHKGLSCTWIFLGNRILSCSGTCIWGQKPLLLLDVFTLQRPVLHMEVSISQGPELHLDFWTTGPVLLVEVSTCTRGACAAPGCLQYATGACTCTCLH
jgi:hypothetical protein